MVDIEIHDALPNTAILARCQTAYRFHGKATMHALIVITKHKKKGTLRGAFLHSDACSAQTNNVQFT
ncbi:hypothetical protein [Vibrio sp. B181a]|uniref:hypothetical protein n=1 Tax=Vibrio sp. B181a TaxID=2835906 RepID=UPI002556D947|nr:hypothetical protein [Vibrio sp. B181a]MDK9770624.1 hypothetical protein [Vibrio sp. B181a]